MTGLDILDRTPVLLGRQYLNHPEVGDIDDKVQFL
jgi:hypothetical protein